MQHDLREFLAQLVGTAALALVPVVVIAFMSMPMTLERHPGDAVVSTGLPTAHMT